jgi:flagellum-specific peptidoglycan hydrolase FlgJ
VKVLSQPIILAAQAAQHVTRVPASVSLAQYGLESAWGAKVTGRNNFFGIKAIRGQAGQLCETHEVIDGRSVLTHALFREFASPAEAFMAHAELLASAPVYKSAMAHLPDVTTFVRAMATHYATDPDYADKLLSLINEDDLAKYDITLKVAA